MDSPFPVNFEENIDTASAYLKVLANRGRLIVMCKIVRKPHTVSELVDLTGMAQPALSMHLGRLREAGMVSTERSGKEIYYSIASSQLRDLVDEISYKFQCW